MSEVKDCRLTGMVIMLTANTSASSVPFWVSVLLFGLATIEFARCGYYILSR